MVTERVAIWDFFNVKDCDFCLKLCRILNKLKKITHFLEEIYKTYFQDVYYFVLAMSKDPHIAEEITQETFFKALKGVKHFQGKCSIKSWLCQIARNEYISYTRKKHRTDQELTEQAYSDGKTDGPEQRMLRKDEAMTVYQILHYLDEPYKEVFTLKVLGELNYKEIAQIFGKQETWARVTYHRARVKIQDISCFKCD